MPANNLFATIDSCVGQTPLVRLQRMAAHTDCVVLAKLEGNNPAGSVKDRPALNMINQAEARGEIKPGDLMVTEAIGGGLAWGAVALRW